MQHTNVPLQMGAPCAQTGTQSYKQRMCHHDAPFCRHDSGKWGITPEAVRQSQEQHKKCQREPHAHFRLTVNSLPRFSGQM